jgi:tetratricopeptide (TPR) repeat protein
MKKTLLLSAAVALALLPLPLIVAHAQSGTQNGGVDSGRANTRAARKAQQGSVAKEAPMYPNAKRDEPKAEATKFAKQFQDITKLLQEQKNDEAIAKADAILADPKATPMDRAFAANYAANAWLDKDNASYEHPITYIQKAIGENALPNNAHFGNMLQLAAMLKNEEKYAESLTYVDRFVAETGGTDDPKAQEIRAEDLFRLKRYSESTDTIKKLMAAGKGSDNLTRMMVANYQEQGKPADAAKALEEMVAAKPGDKVLMLNLASAYQQSDQDAKAAEVVNRMRSAGLITDAKDYDNAIGVLMNAEGHQKEGMALLNEGLEKGILAKDYQSYAKLGQLHYNADQIPQAIDAWSKAAPLAKDGEMYLNLAKLQLQEDKWADAKSSAQQGLAKGVKKKGDAWLVIAAAELGAKNNAGVLAAYREAAKYPETKKEAENALRQAGAK